MWNCIAWVAVRKSKETGEEWLDTETVSLLRELSVKTVNDNLKLIPHWEKEHPVVKYVRVKLVEV